MKGIESYQAVVKENLVEDTTFLDGKPHRLVHRSFQDYRYWKDGKLMGCAYWVEGVEPL